MWKISFEAFFWGGGGGGMQRGLPPLRVAMSREWLGIVLRAHVRVCCIQIYNRFPYEMNGFIIKVKNIEYNYGLRGIYWKAGSLMLHPLSLD